MNMDRDLHEVDILEGTDALAWTCDGLLSLEVAEILLGQVGTDRSCVFLSNRGDEDGISEELEPEIDMVCSSVLWE